MSHMSIPAILIKQYGQLLSLMKVKMALFVVESYQAQIASMLYKVDKTVPKLLYKHQCK